MCVLLVLCASAVKGEIIDRIAASVDTNVITQSQMLEEIRITAFLNGEPPDFSPQNRRHTADRLVDQLIVRREMDLTRYPQPTPADTQDTLQQVAARFPDEAAYRAALQRYSLTEDDIKGALLRQAALLRFIELRFRPEVQIQEPELLQHYDSCVAEAQKENRRPPTREQCDEALISQRVDQRVEAWLKEMRARSRIQFQEDAFQ